MINNVENGIRLPLFDAIPHGREIGGGVEERAVLLLHDERSFMTFEKHTLRAVGLLDETVLFQRRDNVSQTIVIKTLAERVVESDVQAGVGLVDLGQASGEKATPEGFVRGIAGVQRGSFGQHGGADVGVFGGELGQLWIVVDRGDGVAQAIERFSQLRQLAFGLAELFLGLFAPLVVFEFRRIVHFFQPRGDVVDLLFDGGDLLLTRGVVVDQLADELVQSRQLRHGCLVERPLVDKMFVAVDDHAELGAPIADVIVANHAMAQLVEHAVEGGTDHGRTDVANVHRLSNIRRGVVDDVGLWLGNRLQSELSHVLHHRDESLGEPLLANRQVDKARAGDGWRLAKVVDFELIDQLLGDFARLLLEAFAQRHRAIGLIVTKLTVLAGQDHIGQLDGARVERFQGGREALAKFGKQVHRLWGIRFRGACGEPVLLVFAGSFFLPRQRDATGLIPEVFERVELAHLLVEDMNHDGPVVEQNPATFAVAFDAHPLIVEVVFQAVVDLFADGVQLSAAVTGDKDEVVEYRRDLAHVEHDDVLATVIFRGTCGGHRELQATFGALGWLIVGGVGFRNVRARNRACRHGISRGAISHGKAPHFNASPPVAEVSGFVGCYRSFRDGRLIRGWLFGLTVSAKMAGFIPTTVPLDHQDPSPRGRAHR